MPIDASLLLSIEQNRFTDFKLSLVEKNLTDEDMVALVKAIKSNAHIQALDLSVNNITAIGVEYLATLYSLVTLDISANDIGPEGVKFLAKSNLQKINISANPIGSGAGEFSSSTHLVELIASECNITDVGARQLFQSAYIKILDLSTNSINGTSLEIIPSNVVLTELNLSQNGLRSECLQFFTTNKALIYLNLTNVFIDTNDITKLIENSVLEELILVQCLINDDGARELSKSHTLKRLELFNNRITDIGAKHLLENMSLLYLGLNTNPITSGFVEQLRKSYAEYLGNSFTRTPEFIDQLKLQKKRPNTAISSGDTSPITSSPLITSSYTSSLQSAHQNDPHDTAITIATDPRYVGIFKNFSEEQFELFFHDFHDAIKPPPSKIRASGSVLPPGPTHEKFSLTR